MFEFKDMNYSDFVTTNHITCTIAHCLQVL
jgi:hypothetical protein